jgi:outer membrane immunogenic protein
MKNVSLRISLIVMAAFAVSAAQAADLPRPSYKAPAYTSADPIFSWTGFYVGANVGYGYGSSDWTGPVPASPSPKGFVGGGQLGYNYQYSAFVFGLEADIDYSTIKGDAPCALGTCTTKNSYIFTGRGRIGYAFDRFLPYITGGVAYGNIKAEDTVLGGASGSKLGYALGAGLEYAFSGAWSVRAEYLYMDLGNFTCGAPCGGAAETVSFKPSLIRLGVNYRF